jgi:hypothetical protein
MSLPLAEFEEPTTLLGDAIALASFPVLHSEAAVPSSQNIPLKIVPYAPSDSQNLKYHRTVY